MKKSAKRSIEFDAIDVYCSEMRCGILSRTLHGSEFRYDRSFLSSPARPKNGIAIQIPYQEEPIRTEGVNLHPFFAGLLPEGLRLEAIIAKAQTSRDDLFTLLIEAGSDCIGDVYVRSPNDELGHGQDAVDIAKVVEDGFDDYENALLRGASGASIPGVQPKLSAELLSRPVGPYRGLGPSILKLAPATYPMLVENEHFFMMLAGKCGLIVPRTAVIADKTGRRGLLVERFDRYRKNNALHLLHQEDACQFCNRYPADKYRLSMREIGESILELAEASAVAVNRLCQLYIYSYAIGNADLHAKNISLFRTGGQAPMTLTPAYDLVSTLAFPQLESSMALHLDGKANRFRSADFVAFFGRLGEKETVVREIIARIARKVGESLADLDSIGYDARTTTRMRTEIERRIRRLTD
jgi:serine/threonine-protein kinase HipA